MNILEILLIIYLIIAKIFLLSIIYRYKKKNNFKPPETIKNQNDEICTICLETIKQNTDIYKLLCCH